jgi:hypothetical protein
LIPISAYADNKQQKIGFFNLNYFNKIELQEYQN